MFLLFNKNINIQNEHFNEILITFTNQKMTGLNFTILMHFLAKYYPFDLDNEKLQKGMYLINLLINKIIQQNEQFYEIKRQSSSQIILVSQIFQCYIARIGGFQQLIGSFGNFYQHQQNQQHNFELSINFDKNIFMGQQIQTIIYSIKLQLKRIVQQRKSNNFSINQLNIRINQQIQKQKLNFLLNSTNYVYRKHDTFYKGNEIQPKNRFQRYKCQTIEQQATQVDETSCFIIEESQQAKKNVNCPYQVNSIKTQTSQQHYLNGNNLSDMMILKYEQCKFTKQ